MKASLVTLIFLTMTGTTMAKEQVNIYSFYSPASVAGQSMNAVTGILNSLTEDYNFRYSVMPGAEGEVATTTAIEMARNGRKVLWAGAVSALAFNDGTKWKNEDLTILRAISSNSPTILVAKDSPFNSVDDLVTHMKNHEKVYAGQTSSSKSFTLLNKMFIDKNGLTDKVATINYGSLSDMSAALERGEIDYVIFNAVDFPTAKVVYTFDYKTLSLIGVPSSVDPEFKLRVTLLLTSVAQSQELKNTIESRGYSSALSYSHEEIDTIINQEAEIYRQYRY